MTEKAKIALEVYRDRGRLALGFFRAGNQSEFEGIMKKRAAAFHNFAALDHQALADGLDVANDPRVREIWNDITQINAELATLMTKSLKKTEKTIAKGTMVRRKIDRYHSGGPRKIKFLKAT